MQHTRIKMQLLHDSEGVPTTLTTHNNVPAIVKEMLNEIKQRLRIKKDGKYEIIVLFFVDNADNIVCHIRLCIHKY